MSPGSRRLIAVLVVLLIGAAVPVVYFFVIEPGITKTDYAAELMNGPSPGEVSQYHWFGVFDEHTTRRPLRDREIESLQLVVMLVALSKSPDGERFSSGGSAGYTADGDRSDFHYDLHVSGTTTIEIGMNDDWSQPPTPVEGVHIEGEGNRTEFAIGGKAYDLAEGRVFLSDRQGVLHQLDWLPTSGTQQAIDKQVSDLIRGMGYLP
jgi:hypothetical protein